MAKIGWGTPTLISVSLGVIIEIPGNIVILGRLAVALPTADEPVLLLQLTFIGALEFDKRRLWFFASLFDSRILFITIDGEMGLLIDYSDNPNFVLSVGGFHPQLQAAAAAVPDAEPDCAQHHQRELRAGPRRGLLRDHDQLGAVRHARPRLFFGFDALSVEGYFSFDALLRFSPLYFDVGSPPASRSRCSASASGACTCAARSRARRRGTSTARPRSSCCSSTSTSTST